MQISLRFIFLAGILVMLLPNSLIYELFGMEEEMVNKISNIIFVVYVLFTFLYRNKIEGNFLKWLYYILLIALVALSLESYAKYNSFFRYPHVFSKITDLFTLFFIYLFYKKFGKIYLKDISYLIFILFLVNIFFVNRDYLSFSAFAAHERGISATVVYLLLIPCLYFFNAYLTKEKYLDLVLFLVVLGFIIFFQHRTLWVTSAILLFLNMLFFYKTGKRLNLRLALPFFTIVSIAFLMGYMVVISNEKVVEQINDNIEDILNPTTRGTAGWRFRQYASYWPFVSDNIVLGMRFEGFELPIQFYNEEAGEPVFPEGHGHHFHSFYLDKLFYFGLFGLLFLLAPVVYLIARAFRKKNLDPDELALTVFTFSGFIYALSYDWPGFFLGIVGFAYYYFETNEKGEEQDDVAEYAEEEYVAQEAV